MLDVSRTNIPNKAIVYPVRFNKKAFWFLLYLILNKQNDSIDITFLYTLSSLYPKEL
jgi:hypothetical protein